MSEIIPIETIVKAHELMRLPSPKHPLVSVVMPEDFKLMPNLRGAKIIPGFYQVMFKMGECGNLQYGRNSYDYEDGTLIFTGPGQTMELEETNEEIESVNEGWTLAFHPDLIRQSTLGEKIEDYNFFQYEVTEALHLSDAERKTIEEIRDKIVVEYSQNLDRHSQKLIIANIELLLDYCLRFYDRQFLTRANLNTDLISRFEKILKGYYQSDLPVEGIPSVHFCADQLHLSANYLSDLLKKETGKTAQEHIHLFVLEKAKNRLRHGTESISEIAYSLGFEYPQHFSNLFKAKVGQSPRAYRQGA